MTYGWAILIIAIVLAILFKLGVFSGASLTGTSCLGTVGWSCSSLTYSGTGLSFTLGQSTGTTINNVIIACSSSAGSGGYPLNGYWYNPTVTTTPANLPLSNSLVLATLSASTTSIPNAGTTSVSGLVCGGMTPGTVGQTFQGYVWVAYEPAGSTTPQITQALTVSAKETS